MSGKHTGLQAILRENYTPRGIYVHCSTHRLNLVIVDACKGVPYVDEFFSIMSKLHDYFSSSGVTNEHFRNAQQLLNIGMYVLHLICCSRPKAPSTRNQNSSQAMGQHTMGQSLGVN
jgi:hypothetical protein